jgi:hypothetical protein
MYAGWRITEQHDIFLELVLPWKKWSLNERFWPEAKGRIHIDAWREVAAVDNFSIEIIARSGWKSLRSFVFHQLGGYKENEFEEYHYKTLTVAQSMDWHPKKKQKHFFKHCGFKELAPHISTTNTEST